jgi:hypothetical protein
MPDDDKRSPSKAIIAWGTLATLVITATIAVLQFRRTDTVTPYQQQVHAACNRMQQIETATAQTLAQGVAMDLPFSQGGPGGGGIPSNPIASPGPLVMPTLLVDKAVVLPALQSNYDSTKLEFDLLDQKQTPPALRDQKRRQGAVKDSYLATLRSFLQRAQHDLPDRPTVNQVAALFASPTAAVEINDAMSALAGGDCTVTPPVTNSSPAR